MSSEKKQAGLHRNFYGRLKGKALKPAQKADLEQLLPKLALPDVHPDENPERRIQDPREWFSGRREIWVEIGFGGGEHMVHQALNNPDVGIIGCEPYINGVAMGLRKIREQKPENIRLYAGDARDLMDVLPQGSIDKAFLLYPDPWPKARHHRRRFVTQEHLVPLARILRPGAEFRIATDIADYVRQALEELHANGSFEWLANGPQDWRKPWPDWISTRYEKKAIREGRPQHYLTFERNEMMRLDGCAGLG